MINDSTSGCLLGQWTAPWIAGLRLLRWTARASGGVLDLLFAVDEADVADHLGEPGGPVESAPASFRALA
jgi:hypothetical protein